MIDRAGQISYTDFLLLKSVQPHSLRDFCQVHTRRNFPHMIQSRIQENRQFGSQKKDKYSYLGSCGNLLKPKIPQVQKLDLDSETYKQQMQFLRERQNKIKAENENESKDQNEIEKENKKVKIQRNKIIQKILQNPKKAHEKIVNQRIQQILQSDKKFYVLYKIEKIKQTLKNDLKYQKLLNQYQTEILSKQKEYKHVFQKKKPQFFQDKQKQLEQQQQQQNLENNQSLELQPQEKEYKENITQSIQSKDQNCQNLDIINKNTESVQFKEKEIELIKDYFSDENYDLKEEFIKKDEILDEEKQQISDQREINLIKQSNEQYQDEIDSLVVEQIEELVQEDLIKISINNKNDNLSSQNNLESGKLEINGTIELLRTKLEEKRMKIVMECLKKDDFDGLIEEKVKEKSSLGNKQRKQFREEIKIQVKKEEVSKAMQSLVNEGGLELKELMKDRVAKNKIVEDDEKIKNRVFIEHCQAILENKKKKIYQKVIENNAKKNDSEQIIKQCYNSFNEQLFLKNIRKNANQINFQVKNNVSQLHQLMKNEYRDHGKENKEKLENFLKEKLNESQSNHEYSQEKNKSSLINNNKNNWNTFYESETEDQSRRINSNSEYSFQRQNFKRIQSGKSQQSQLKKNQNHDLSQNEQNTNIKIKEFINQNQKVQKFNDNSFSVQQSRIKTNFSENNLHQNYKQNISQLQSFQNYQNYFQGSQSKQFFFDKESLNTQQNESIQTEDNNNQNDELNLSNNSSQKQQNQKKSKNKKYYFVGSQKRVKNEFIKEKKQEKNNQVKENQILKDKWLQIYQTCRNQFESIERNSFSDKIKKLQFQNVNDLRNIKNYSLKQLYKSEKVYFETFEENQRKKRFKDLLIKTINTSASQQEKEMLIVYTNEQNYLKFLQEKQESIKKLNQTIE